MTQPLHVVALITVAANHLDRIAAELARFVHVSRHETGCLHYEINRVLEHPGRFVVVEQWASQTALDSHMQTPSFLALTGLLQNLGAQLDIMTLTPLAS